MRKIIKKITDFYNSGDIKFSGKIYLRRWFFMSKARIFSEYRMLYSSTDEYPSTMRFIIELKDNINIKYEIKEKTEINPAKIKLVI